MPFFGVHHGLEVGHIEPVKHTFWKQVQDTVPAISKIIEGGPQFKRPVRIFRFDPMETFEKQIPDPILAQKQKGGNDTGDTQDDAKQNPIGAHDNKE